MNYPSDFDTWSEAARNSFFADNYRKLKNSNGHDKRQSNQPDKAYERSADKTFTLIPFEQIKFDGQEEWRVKKLLPKQGVAVFFGAKSTFKSFGAMDCGLHVSVGWNWAGRRVTQAPVVYIAAEGAAGVRKRKTGFELQHGEYLPAVVPFFMIAAAPNLGTGDGDLKTLITATESNGVTPGIVIIDTLSQTLGGAEENGAGMQQVIANAQALSEHFKCLVLIVHHSGLSDADRPRGHSSLGAALDALIHFERKEETKSSIMTVQKLKDEDDEGIAFELKMTKIIIGTDKDGDEISTLIVESIEPVINSKPVLKEKVVPRSQRLLMTIVKEAIDEAGENFKPFPDGPWVRGVHDQIVRDRLYAKIAEEADPDDDLTKVSEKRRKAFNRAVEAEIKAKALVAGIHKKVRYLWTP